MFLNRLQAVGFLFIWGVCMMILAAYAVPHPPLIIPAIGAGRQLRAADMSGRRGFRPVARGGEG